MRKVCYISGTRADYGLMKNTLISIHEKNNLDLSILVTGMHLIPEYGETWQEIKDDGFNILKKISVKLDGSSGSEMSIALGEQIIGFTDVLQKENPDILLLLGDRGETLAGAIAAIHLNIHIVHIHGGELSGTIDESIRHAISKLSHYHFVATEKSRNRLESMGENPKHIFVVGAPGLDSIKKAKIHSKHSLYANYELNHEQPLLILLFHSVVQQSNKASEQIDIILQAVVESKMQSLVLLPNSDAGGAEITNVINKFRDRGAIKVAIHIPRAEFLSLMSYASLIVGNSSSGIIESASFGTPAVNIGSRQLYRERNENVIDVKFNKDAILSAITKANKMKRKKWHNVYGKGDSTGLIIKNIEKISLSYKVLEKINAY
jgi:GDP/UDP-N,N'-diacetylbacillosamine 2-epimerase (hydrolysing)